MLFLKVTRVVIKKGGYIGASWGFGGRPSLTTIFRESTNFENGKVGITSKMRSRNNFENIAVETMTKQKIGIGEGRFSSPSKKLYLVWYSHYLFAVHTRIPADSQKKTYFMKTFAFCDIVNSA